MKIEKAFRAYGRTDGPTDGRTDGRTDRPSYRDARTHLKIGASMKLIQALDRLLGGLGR